MPLYIMKTVTQPLPLAFKSQAFTEKTRKMAQIFDKIVN